MYLLFASAYLYTALHIPPLVPFSTITSISLSVNNSNSTSVFFRHACHANPGADRKCAGSSRYISMHLSLKFSYTSASSIASLWTYKS